MLILRQLLQKTQERIFLQTTRTGLTARRMRAARLRLRAGSQCGTGLGCGCRVEGEGCVLRV